MRQYLDLLRRVYENGEDQPSRSVLESTGEKPNTRSVFGYQCRYDLREGFPLVTTKYVPFRQVAAELAWFLSGSTCVDQLHRSNVRIWDQWASEEGDLGPIYGKLWRDWQGYDGCVDQIAELVAGIRAVAKDPQDSRARRLILTSWDPSAMRQVKGPSGCHTLSQFYVSKGRLSCHLYQRSADLFLGVPWNIACYALLTHLLAKLAGLEPFEFIHSFGDAHIYENHLSQVAEQLTREPLPLPQLKIDARFGSINRFDPSWVSLDGYASHPRLSGEVAV